jgi:hypothetical protein
MEVLVAADFKPAPFPEGGKGCGTRQRGKSARCGDLADMGSSVLDPYIVR